MTDKTIWRSGIKTDNDPKKQYTENYGEKQENLELMYESRSCSCTTSGTHRVTVVTNPWVTP